MYDAVSIGTLTAFAAGIVSFLSPCVLPLVPAYLSYIAGNAADTNYRRLASARLSAAFLSAHFVLGFSLVFILLGAGATALGRLLLQYRYEAGIAGGIIVTVFGLFMLGGTKWLTFLQRDFRFHVGAPAARPLSAFILGIAFAFGWTLCIGPVLGAILTVSAVQDEMSAGIRLLAAYSLGLGVPFLLTAICCGRMKIDQFVKVVPNQN